MTSVNQNSSKRVPYIDALKGLAIVLVVLGHVATGQDWKTENATFFLWIYNIPYSFHMPLFIILSGTVFQRAYCDPNGNPVNRKRLTEQILNLVILYILWSLILGVFKMFFGGYVNHPVTWLTLVLIPAVPIQLFWYLHVLIIYYIVFGLFKAAKMNRYIGLAITFCLSVVSFFVPSNIWFSAKRLLFYSFFFFLGITLLQFEQLAEKESARKILRILVAVLFAAAVVLCVVFWDAKKFLNDRFLVNIVIGTGISLGLYLAFKLIRPLGECRLLCYLGKHCLDIYLLHTFPLSAGRTILNKLGVTSAVLVVVIEVLAGILLPLLFTFICRKIHIYDILFTPYKFIKKLRHRSGQPS